MGLFRRKNVQYTPIGTVKAAIQVFLFSSFLKQFQHSLQQLKFTPTYAALTNTIIILRKRLVDLTLTLVTVKCDE